MFRCNHHHQGARYSSLLKLQLLNNQLKYIGVVNSNPDQCNMHTYTNKDLIIYAATLSN
jgi:hypothetical protein